MAPIDKSSSVNIQSTTTSMPLPTSYHAAHAVLGTNELLCKIVTNLPFRDIVSATGACRAWRNALAADVSIQRALFLKPTKVREVFVGDELINKHTKSLSLEDIAIIGELHPTLRKICGVVRGDWSLSRASTLLKLARAFEDLPDIWLDMFITRPPCIVARMFWKLSHERNEHRLENNDGLTFRDLHKLVGSNSSIMERYPINILIHNYEFLSDNHDIMDRQAVRCKVRNGEVHISTTLPDRFPYVKQGKLRGR